MRYIESINKGVNEMEDVQIYCGIDTKTGKLTGSTIRRRLKLGMSEHDALFSAKKTHK